MKTINFSLITKETLYEHVKDEKGEFISKSKADLGAIIGEIEVDLSDTEAMFNMVSEYVHTPYVFNFDENGKKRRKNSYFKQANAIVFDFDSNLTVEEFEQTEFAKYNHMIYCSKSHTKEWAKFHLLFELTVPITDVGTLKNTVVCLKRMMDKDGLEADANALDASRMLYPSRKNGKTECNPLLKDSIKYVSTGKFIDQYFGSLYVSYGLDKEDEEIQKEEDKKRIEKEERLKNGIKYSKTTTETLDSDPYLKKAIEYLWSPQCEGKMYFSGSENQSLVNIELMKNNLLLCGSLYSLLGDTGFELYEHLTTTKKNGKDSRIIEQIRHNSAAYPGDNGCIVNVATELGFTYVSEYQKKLDMLESIKKANKMTNENAKKATEVAPSEIAEQNNVKVEDIKEKYQKMADDMNKKVEDDISILTIEMESVITEKTKIDNQLTKKAEDDEVIDKAGLRIQSTKLKMRLDIIKKEIKNLQQIKKYEVADVVKMEKAKKLEERDMKILERNSEDDSISEAMRNNQSVISNVVRNIKTNNISEDTYLYLINQEREIYNQNDVKIYFHSTNKGMKDWNGQAVIYKLDETATLRGTPYVPLTDKHPSILQACAYSMGVLSEDPVTSIMHRFVGENNTNERGYVIKYSNNGEVTNMDEIIDFNKQGVIYSNPLDMNDTYYTKRMLNVAPSIKVPRNVSKDVLIQEAELFEYYIDKLYGRYCAGTEYMLKGLAQTIIENRTTGKLSFLFQSAERGLGKGLISSLIQWWFGGSAAEIITGSEFSSFRDKPIIYSDEGEANRAILYKILKQVSGSPTISVRYLHREPFLAKCTAVSFVMSNKQCIKITDQLQDANDNQWIYVLITDTSNLEVFKEMKEHRIEGEITHFDVLARCMTSWVYTKGLQWFYKILQERKTGVRRYGFSIPVTQALRELQANSMPAQGTPVIQAWVNDIMQNIGSTVEGTKSFNVKMFVRGGVHLSSFTQYDPKVDTAKLKEQLISMGVIDEIMGKKTLNGKTYTIGVINETKIKEHPMFSDIFDNYDIDFKKWTVTSRPLTIENEQSKVVQLFGNK